MKTRIFSFLSLTCILSISIFLTGIAYAGTPVSLEKAQVSLHVEPNPIPVGDLALVTLTTSQNDRLMDVEFMNKHIPYYPLGKNKYWFFLVAGLKTEPGRYPLHVKIDQTDRTVTAATTIYVEYRSFPMQNLTLPKNMVNLKGRILRRVLTDERVIERTVSKVHKKILWIPPFIWPVKGKIISAFGLKRILDGEPRSQHRGVDLEAPYGTPVKAANCGKIALIRNCYLSGRTVIIDHGGGLYTLYAHLSRVYVRQGDYIDRGQTIGLSGQSGRATGPHLHWGISYLGIRIDPQAFMSILGER